MKSTTEKEVNDILKRYGLLQHKSLFTCEELEKKYKYRKTFKNIVKELEDYRNLPDNVEHNLRVRSGYVSPNGYRLRRMVDKIRSGNYPLLEEERLYLDAMGFIWDEKEFDFKKLVNEIIDYKAKNKCDELIIPTQYVTDTGYHLGRRVAEIRKNKKRLDDLHIRVLDELGIIWDLEAYKFNVFCKHFDDYIKCYGADIIDFSYKTKDGYYLGKKIFNIKNGIENITKEQMKFLNENYNFESIKVNKKAWSDSEVYNYALMKDLVMYISKYGKQQMPDDYVDENGVEVGKKVKGAKQKQKAGNLSLEWQEIFESLGVEFGEKGLSKTEIFDRFVEEYVKYKQINGNANIPYSYVTLDGYHLGARIMILKNDSWEISQEQRKVLEDLGFDFRKNRIIKNYRKREIFEKIKEEMIAYKQEFGNLSISYNYVSKSGFELGQYVNKIRRKKFSLSNKQLNELKEIGFILSEIKIKKIEEKEKFLNELVLYKEKFGNLKIPSKYVTESGYDLGLKAMDIRNNQNAVDANFKESLDKIGFIWDMGAVLKEDRMNKIIDELIKYKEEFGDLRIATNYKTEDGFHLGGAVYRLRRKNREKEKIDYIEKLDEIGFVWDCVQDKRNLVYEELKNRLKEYKEEFGDVNINYYYVTEDGYRLGFRIAEMRKWDKELKLTTEQKQELMDLGLKFNKNKKKEDKEVQERELVKN